MKGNIFIEYLCLPFCLWYVILMALLKYICCHVINLLNIIYVIKIVLSDIYQLYKRLKRGRVPVGIIDMDIKVNDELNIKSKIVTRLSLYDPSKTVSYDDAKMEIINIIKQIIEKGK